MPKPAYVRVKSKATGHEFSVTELNAKRHADAYEVLKKPATDAAGDPLPPKYKTTVDKAAEKKASAFGRSADTTKEDN